MNRNHVCEEHLRYVAHIGAPGYGQSWECAICGRGCWRASPYSPPEFYDDPEFVPHELTEDDVR
jgi:hypothetical protein